MKLPKPPGGGNPVIPIAILVIGAYITWFSVHYFKSDTKWPTDPLKAVLTGGGVPTPTYTGEQQRVGAVAGQVGKFLQGAAISPVGSNAIADAAQRYIGQGYVWGGSASHPGDWDCSSFVSYVLGHDLGLPLPGGHWGDPGFPPNAHGPTTGSYLLYGGPIDQTACAAGDLVVWSSHMGIAVNNTQVCSARDPQEGVGISSIAGTTSELGETPQFRRVSVALGTAGGSTNVFTGRVAS
jgi:cell wall-associated NlpC family hydrolase